MDLNVQKRMAGKVLKCSPKRAKLNPEFSDDIKEATTKRDIRSLVREGSIVKNQKKGVSKARANKRAEQKKKGLRRGRGKKKGTKNANFPRKKLWILKIRSQRNFLKELKEKNIVNTKDYHELYNKAKGGFFRNKRHIKIFIEEHELAKNKKAK
ncbi:MAG: 50S ribosomal protein L19e [Candidatus Woesearchaeota archaeon]